MRWKHVLIIAVRSLIVLCLFTFVYTRLVDSDCSNCHISYIDEPGLRISRSRAHENEGISDSQVVLDQIQDTTNASSSKQTNPSEESLHKLSPVWWSNHIEATCNQLKMSTNVSAVPITELSKVLVDDKHKLLYCQIAKVASTNWGKIFAVLVGLYNGTNPNNIPSSDIHSTYNSRHLHLYSLPRSDILQRIKDYYKFIFVRDPFERLLSAYRNKFSKITSSSFAYLSRRIVKIYRQNKNLTGNVTFEEFLLYVADPLRRVPTNSHWTPFYELCRPCEMKFDFVGQIRSFNKDTRHILQVNNLTHLVEFPRQADNSHSLHQTDLLLQKYYKDIPKSLLRDLYTVYYPDYSIFDLKLPKAIEELMK